jgi:hypothetical protein
MEFSDIRDKIETSTRRLLEAQKYLNKEPEKAKEIVVQLTDNEKKQLGVKEKKRPPMSREEFKILIDGAKRTKVADLKVGDFVRYMQKKGDDDLRYLWGGLVVYIDTAGRYLRLKNLGTRATWSVQLQSDNLKHTFWVLQKNMDKDESLVDALAKLAAAGNVDMLKQALKIAKSSR